MQHASISFAICGLHKFRNFLIKYLKTLNAHKFPGPDLILPRILKECAHELSTPLCAFFNKSFSTGLLPADWKMANITPIHKKGHKHKKENYRQLSLTSVVCKVAENIVRSRVTAFWPDHHVLNPNQLTFGYLKGKSTLAELLSCYHYWCSTRNSSKATDVIFLDLSKAFDKVPHERLLLKLNRFGIDGPLLLWFRTFSTWSPVTSGVPQGTILGPTLFLLYVNDIPNVVTSSIKMFADDTKIYREINNAEDTLALQSDLDCSENWTRSWEVKFNPLKCEVMRITRITHARTWVFTCDLSWSNHVDAIVNKANKVVGLLKRTVGNKNREIFSMLYKSLVRPILEYACPVWSPYLVKDKLAIEKVQRRASRNALGQKLFYFHLCTLHIAKLEHTSAPERIPICSGMLQDSVWSKWPRL